MDIRWSDLDPNFHLRHSAYYDLGAVARLDFLQQKGITVESLQKQSIGLVIFREECVFKKEIFLNDSVTIDLKLLKASGDYSRWSMRHTIFKNKDTIAAILTLDGAWIDVAKRKLTKPPASIYDAIKDMPRDEHFEF